MGYTKQIYIESQNIYEDVIFSLLDKIEIDIQNLLDLKFPNESLQESIIDAVIRLYEIYQLIQVDLWDR